MFFSPFEQFRLVALENFGGNLVISNSLVNLIFVVFGFLGLGYLLLSMRKKKYEFSIFSWAMQQLYVFFYEVTATYVGNHVNRFFPFMFYTFLFIFLNNLVGLLPYSFTVTSHFVVTFGLSFTMWFGMFLLGLAKWKLAYFSLFYPKGLSIPLLFLLCVLECISNIFRMFSLALRLLANMVAGHILLDCMSFLIYKTFTTAIWFPSVSILSVVMMIIPVVGFLGLLMFEVGVCVLQAYIFVVLSCIYLKEVL